MNNLILFPNWCMILRYSILENCSWNFFYHPHWMRFVRFVLFIAFSFRSNNANSDEFWKGCNESTQPFNITSWHFPTSIFSKIYYLLGVIFAVLSSISIMAVPNFCFCGGLGGPAEFLCDFTYIFFKKWKFLRAFSLLIFFLLILSPSRNNKGLIGIYIWRFFLNIYL